MESQFWHDCWADRDIGFHQSEINADLIRFWPTLNLSKSGRVLVPMCGKSRDLVWLAEQGFQVVGLELSKVAVVEFFEELGVEPKLRSDDRFEIYRAGHVSILCGDFFDATGDDVGPISAIYDRASLVALPADMRKRYADHLGILAPRHPPTLLLTFDYDTAGFDGPPFCVNQQELTRLFGDRYRIELLDDHPFTLPGVEATELVFRMTSPGR